MAIKIGTCGSYTMSIPNGQFYRTEAVTEELKRAMPNCLFSKLDYANWKKHPFSLLFSFLKMLWECDYVIVFPDENAIKAIIPLAVLLRPLHRAKIYYVVIGGWLPVFMDGNNIVNKFVSRYVKKLDMLFVQTQVLKDSLGKRKVPHVDILQNFRLHDFSKFKYSEYSDEDRPLKSFFLCRIEEPKGVEEMIEVVKKVNKNKICCYLDIFGGIQEGYEERFKQLVTIFPEYISYRGALKPNDINDVIHTYDLQLFPTKYRTEGFPGSILDSFYAGVPVLASRWNSATDILDDGEDSLIFEFNNFDDMENKLTELVENRNLLNHLKRCCRKKGNRYRGSECIRTLTRYIK